MDRRLGYFGIASQLKLFDKLDQWIRRRIRMCYWKQWKRPKRRWAMLIRLTNKWLQEQGLLSLTTLWAQLAPLRRTA